MEVYVYRELDEAGGLLYPCLANGADATPSQSLIEGKMSSA